MPQPEEPRFEDVSLFALLEAFRQALERAATVRDLHIIPERTRIEDKVDALLRRMTSGDAVFLHELFADAATREEIVLTFIAMLELVRLGAVRISQAALGAPIFCAPTERLRHGGTEFRERLLASILGQDAEVAQAEATPAGPPS